MFQSLLFAFTQAFYGILFTLYAVKFKRKYSILKEVEVMDVILNKLISARDKKCMRRAAKLLGSSDVYDEYFIRECSKFGQNISATRVDMGKLSIVQRVVNATTNVNIIQEVGHNG